MEGSIDQILDLKKWSLYDYIQDNIFPSQSSLKSFLFKMFIYGLTIGVDIARHMQPRGDLEGVWLIFNHYKCVW